MSKGNHLSSIAEYGRQWIEDKKENDFDGAKFFWNKDKAREFSNVSLKDLLFDEYFLDAEDWLWSGLVDPIKELWHAYKEEGKNIICIIGGFGCLPGYAPIKTTDGYKNMGEINIGDTILSPDKEANTTKRGKVINKVNSGKKEVFRIHTKDGYHIDGTKEHVYKIKRQYWDYGKYREEIEEWSIGEIIDYLDSNKLNSKNVGLLRPKYIDYGNDDNNLKIHPYVLGVLLGGSIIKDDSIRLVSYFKDKTIRDKFSKLISDYDCVLKNINVRYIYSVVGNNKNYGKKNNLLRLLKEYGISSKNKFIPDCYLKASRENRIELLSGLLDVSGCCHRKSSYEFVHKRYNLVESYKTLVEELGGRATVSKKTIDGSDYYRAYSVLNFNVPCTLDRKKTEGKRQRDYRKHKLDSYERLGYMDTYDITVDTDSHCFLSYNDFITHNSGKTAAIGSVLTWLSWYDFTCKFDSDSDIASPQEYYNLKPTSTVAFVALSKTVKKSKDITFSEIKSSFDTQFNDDYFPINDRVKSEVQIPKNNTVIFPNTATEAANAGYSVYGYVMDEVSFLKITEDSTRAKGSSDGTYNQAESAFQSAEGRRFSRFGEDGIGVLLSSVNYDEDFLVSTIRDIYNYPEENKNKVYKALLPWKANPSDAGWDDGYFYFDTESHKIIDDPEEIAALNRYYQEPNIDDLIFDNPENHDNYEILDRLTSGDISLDEEEIEIAKNNKAYKGK